MFSYNGDILKITTITAYYSNITNVCYKRKSKKKMNTSFNIQKNTYTPIMM